MRATPLLTMLALAVAACGGSVPEGSPSMPSAASPTPALAPVPAPGATAFPRDERPPPASLPEPVPQSGDPAVIGEVPGDLLDSVLADLAERAAVAPASVTVVRGEEVIWPDGSLGCPVPGEVYALAPVPGYRIVLEAGEAAFDYRVATAGWFRLCSP